jgi:predicted LPLAT superfamily acyltransferase
MSPEKPLRTDGETHDSKLAWETTPERSTSFMLKLLVRGALLLGRTGIRPIVYLTTAYFVLTGGRARRTSRDYLRRVLGRQPTLADVWHHFFAFASCSVDRIFLLSGRHQSLKLTIDRPQAVLDAANRGRGCMLVMSHFGSFEALRCSGEHRSLPISILLDREIGRMLTTLLERINPNMAANVIDASKRGPELVLAVKEAIEANRMVGIMADRTREGDRSVRVEFLGSTAALPIGPWLLASALRVPVIIGFCRYLGGNRYDARFELFADHVDLPRAEREQALYRWAKRYADRLEQQVREAPYNWFNFYDFWA